MKAIRLTQEIITLNPHLFRGRAVGDVVTFSTLPSKFIEQIPNVDAIDEDDEQFILLTHHAYQKRTDLHERHGFLNVTEPVIDKETQKLGKLIDNPDLTGFTYQVDDLSAEELDALIPTQMPNMDFKLALASLYNIDDSTIEDALTWAVSKSLITEQQKQISVIKNKTMNVVERKVLIDSVMVDNPELYGLVDVINGHAQSVVITAEQLTDIFKNYSNV